MADVQPFRAVRYTGAAGPLADLVAPPYDAVSESEREELYGRSPYNVVHLTLPLSAEDAGRDYRKWLSSGVLRRDDEPASWFVVEEYEGRELNGVVVSIAAAPYATGQVLPHEHIREQVRDDRLTLLRETRVQLEPIFLLVDGSLGVEAPAGEPDLDANGVRVWRLPGSMSPPLERVQELLIADGHHRYESALELGSGTRVMAFVVSSGDSALQIRPTHRLFRDRPDLVRLREGEACADLGDALARLAEEPFSHSAAVAYRHGHVELVRGADGELDVMLVDRHGIDGVDYTPVLDVAVEAVDRGDVDVAYILRTPRIEDVFAAARRGVRLPPKSTYFVPKPLSGLLFHPLDP